MVWRWSKTASSNSTADSSINWAEGQAPSSINDSARAEMARVAQWRDDISGTVTTGGTSTAYTVTSNQTFDTLAHMDGAIVAFIPHTTSGAAPTLNVDGLGAKKIRFQTGIDIPTGALIQATPYVATYYNAAGEFLLHNIAGNPYNIPLGGLIPYTGAAAPNSAFVMPYGQAISRTTYASYFAIVSTAYGSGDGSSTFNVPDLRGRAIFGWDTMGSSAANRITTAASSIDGTSIGSVGGAQNHTVLAAELPVTQLTATFTGTQQTVSLSQAVLASTGVSVTSGASSLAGTPVTPTVTFTPAGTIAVSSFGSGTAMPIMPPAMILPFILRII